MSNIRKSFRAGNTDIKDVFLRVIGPPLSEYKKVAFLIPGTVNAVEHCLCSKE